MQNVFLCTACERTNLSVYFNNQLERPTVNRIGYNNFFTDACRLLFLNFEVKVGARFLKFILTA